MIFYRKGPKPAHALKKGEAEGAKYAFEDAIDFAVFPSLQGGPHNHQIAALCVALKHCKTPEFVAYQKQVIANARALAAYLVSKGYAMATGGSDNHLVLWDLREQGVTGSKMQTMCDAAHITLNMNSVAGDVSAMTPGGVRIGMPAMTSRGLKEKDFEQAHYIPEHSIRRAPCIAAVRKAAGTYCGLTLLLVRTCALRYVFAESAARRWASSCIGASKSARRCSRRRARSSSTSRRASRAAATCRRCARRSRHSPPNSRCRASPSRACE
jgi:Serine hydroxymethyltransferase